MEYYPNILPMELNNIILAKLQFFFDMDDYITTFKLTPGDGTYKYLIKELYPLVYNTAAELKLVAFLKQNDYEFLDQLNHEWSQSLKNKGRIFGSPVEIEKLQDLLCKISPNSEYMIRVVLKLLYPKVYGVVVKDAFINNNIEEIYKDMTSNYEYIEEINWLGDTASGELIDEKIPMKIMTINRLNGFSAMGVEDDTTNWIFLLNLDIDHLLSLPGGKDCLIKILDQLKVLDSMLKRPFSRLSENFKIPDGYSFYREYSKYVSNRPLT